MFTFIDLFCGIGGFHIALHSVGGTCVFASDSDRECRKVYEQNFGIIPHGDITSIHVNDIPNHDVLTGGFPCQPMSNGGRKKAFEDKRGRLFDDIVRIAKVKQPKVLLLENVKHIKRVSDGQVYRYIYNELHDIGYVVHDIEISPHEIGIPQQRYRVYFICIRKDLATTPLPPIRFEHLHNPKVFEKRVNAKYTIPDELEQVCEAWNVMLQQMNPSQKLSFPILLDEFFANYESISHLPKWKQVYITKNKELYHTYKSLWDSWYRTYKDLLLKKTVYRRLEWQTGPLKGNDSIWDHFIQIRQSGIRVKRNDNFPTLVAIVQVPIYGKEKRYITPRECARLQSFPETFKLASTDRVAYKQLGNSVNVHIVRCLIQHILHYIDS